jgi:hypothetical protein
MLDEKGITLQEINRKYPSSVQTLGYDATMGYDSASKPKVISTFEMAVNIILTLLLMKPGQYPSIPELGINIESYLFEYADDKSIPKKIREELEEQCNRLSITDITIDCIIDELEGNPALILQIEGSDRTVIGSKSKKVVIGVSFDELNQLYSNKIFI